ncbi:diguanylate cyclase (GGDEF)-like protein [Halopolyspora algeriensis]|uniref:Diguanylate cyclase (GGDEF)-like protein n=1 Tax=Halopolyspora algeriensis TaxID=1500506 RepID=A0A368W0N3_9ACTN|nr:GGDEF domain-containing protein [Halopolyspora algeriensis]RCW47192.1 diguanylate cyclase (GGDEF)-like protein [Halopolyspora algeriensis]TQM48278.1 diguanylate cyclase (GGDEF)-like protein [Halopolyspora algeriensis]
MSVVDVAVPSQFTGFWDELIAGLAVGFLLTDERGQVLATNDAAAELMRLDRSDLLTGSRPDGWVMRDDAGSALPDWAELAGQVLRTGTRLSTPLVIAPNGQVSSRIWVDYQPVRTHGRDRVLMLLQPVDSAIAHSRGLLDPLTGLPGRALLLDRLEQALVRSRNRGTLTTLVLVDVRHLSEFNRDHGFDQGDELLGMIAARIRQGMSDEHTVARYGGDEFTVVAEHANGTGVRIAEQVRDFAGRPMRIGRRRVRPNLRVSWVTSDGHAPVHSVVSRAERQLTH